MTFDLNRCYLGRNETAKEILPELNDLTVDLSLRNNQTLWDLISPWLDAFESHPENSAENQFHYEKDDKIYSCSIEWLSGGKHKRGYQIFIEDDTTDQAYIKLLDGYNSDLKTEVEAKTANLVEMHNNLVLSMATMIESRDNSTGGHIRRTSEGVRLLINAMKSMPQPPDGYPMNEEFCRNLIKAAPMHDLGKIAVDDDILRKPGRFTPEEFEIMKTHAAEGARIVHEILKATDDRSFHVIAENVAHYHHERWDGSGYPDKLKGEKIPDPQISLEDGVLRIYAKEKKTNISFNFSSVDVTPKILICCPDKEYTDFSVNVDTGDIILGGVSYKKATLETDTGDVIAKEAKGDEQVIKSDTGDVILSGTFGKTQIKVDTGDIKLSGTYDKGADINSDTGDVVLKAKAGIDAFDLDLRTDTGDIVISENGQKTIVLDDESPSFTRKGSGQLFKVDVDTGDILLSFN